MSEPLRIAWLTTGRGPGSYGALEYTLRAIDKGLPVEIACVFLNRERGEAAPTDRLIAMVEDRGIPVETLSSVAFRKARGGKLSKPGQPLPAWRTEYDHEVVARLKKHDFDLGVMFGYMLIATEPLYREWTFLNDHPALPDGPIGTYQEVIAELIRTRVEWSGCLFNVVTGDLDRGPVVTYCRFPIHDHWNRVLWKFEYPEAQLTADTREGLPLFQDIRKRGVERERPFLVETLRALAAKDIALPPKRAIDLTDAVEAAVVQDAREAFAR